MSFLLSFPILIRNMEIVKQGKQHRLRIEHYFDESLSGLEVLNAVDKIFSHALIHSHYDVTIKGYVDTRYNSDRFKRSGPHL